MIGTTETLIATVAPLNVTNSNVTWSTSDASIATVNNGVVKAVSLGTATIKVITADGNFSASYNVTVSDNSGVHLEIGSSINSNKIIAIGSPIEFTFVDNPQWSAAITNIFHNVLGFGEQDISSTPNISSGKISFPITIRGYYNFGNWTWRIKATGYPDTIVTVEVQ